MAEATKVEPGRYSKQFPELKYVLEYFHEDMFDGFEWEGREPSFREIIRHYKVRNPLTDVLQAPIELQQFLALSHDWDEDQLGDVLGDDFSCMFYAPFFKMTYRQFLEGILAILEEPMKRTQSEFIPQFTG